MKICLLSCSYRLHFLRSWSLRQTRRGSSCQAIASGIAGALFGTAVGVAIFGNPLTNEPSLPTIAENRKFGEPDIGAFDEEYTPSGKMHGDVPNPSASDLAGLSDDDLDRQIDLANTSIEVRGEEQLFGSRDPDVVKGHDERLDREERYFDRLLGERERRDAQAKDSSKQDRGEIAIRASEVKGKTTTIKMASHE